MALVEYTMDEHVAVISMNNGDNRLNPQFLEAFHDVLNTVEKQTDARTLIVRSSHDKIFSNGLDLDWLSPVIARGDQEAVKDFFVLLNRLFKRILLYPAVTIAALTGHAFAGGAILACAFDFRFMRSDRGFFCFPEVDLGIPFFPGMLALIKKAVPMYKFEEMQYTAKRLTAQECMDHHIVHQTFHMDQLMREVLSFAKGLNKNREIIREMKKRLYKNVVHALDVEDTPYIEAGKFHI